MARLLVEHRITGVPVVDAKGRLAGIVSESDLMFRREIATDRRRSWWQRLLADPQTAAEIVPGVARVVDHLRAMPIGYGGT